VADAGKEGVNARGFLKSCINVSTFALIGAVGPIRVEAKQNFLGQA
jgi:hypothetical protein